MFYEFISESADIISLIHLFMVFRSSLELINVLNFHLSIRIQKMHFPIGSCDCWLSQLNIFYACRNAIFWWYWGLEWGASGSRPAEDTFQFIHCPAVNGGGFGPVAT